MENVRNQIESDVREALASQPRIPHPDEIAVDAYGGAVTLRGTVGSLAQRRAAVDTARRTHGVIEVYDDLQVRLLDANRRADAEIRGAALQQLAWDPDIVGEYVHVHVKDRWVTLTGDVDFQHQSDAAFEHVARLRGVTGVTNDIKVVQRMPARRGGDADGIKT
jgi:osmotically-inducible protein OsmY